jgi:hypothetical protein
VVQALPSLHVVPFGFGVGLEQIPVVVAQVPGFSHWLVVVQVTEFPDAVQTPLWQVSSVQRLSSRSQVVPFVRLVGLEQVPVSGLQVPAVWHCGSWTVQVTEFPDAVQTPLWQVSSVQRLSSRSQVVPFGLDVGAEQPVAGLQVPGFSHWLVVVQTVVVPPPQTPAVQVVPVVQALPSSQVVPLGFGEGAAHTPPVHFTSWHGLVGCVQLASLVQVAGQVLVVSQTPALVQHPEPFAHGVLGVGV